MSAKMNRDEAERMKAKALALIDAERSRLSARQAEIKAWFEKDEKARVQELKSTDLAHQRKMKADDKATKSSNATRDYEQAESKYKAESFRSRMFGDGRKMRQELPQLKTAAEVAKLEAKEPGLTRDEVKAAGETAQRMVNSMDKKNKEELAKARVRQKDLGDLRKLIEDGDQNSATLVAKGNVDMGIKDMVARRQGDMARSAEAEDKKRYYAIPAHPFTGTHGGDDHARNAEPDPADLKGAYDQLGEQNMRLPADERQAAHDADQEMEFKHRYALEKAEERINEAFKDYKPAQGDWKGADGVAEAHAAYDKVEAAAGEEAWGRVAEREEKHVHNPEKGIAEDARAREDANRTAKEERAKHEAAFNTGELSTAPKPSPALVPGGRGQVTEFVGFSANNSRKAPKHAGHKEATYQSWKENEEAKEATKAQGTRKPPGRRRMTAEEHGASNLRRHAERGQQARAEAAKPKAPEEKKTDKVTR